MTEAQKRAQYKYKKNHTKKLCLELNIDSDADIIEWISTLENKQGTIKDLIRQKMKETE